MPERQRCAFCGRSPQEGERYGIGPKDWDAPGQICPECFPRGEDDRGLLEKDLDMIEANLEIVKKGLIIHLTTSNKMTDIQEHNLGLWLSHAAFRMTQAAGIFEYKLPLEPAGMKTSAQTVSTFAEWMTKYYPHATQEIKALKLTAELLERHRTDIEEMRS